MRKTPTIYDVAERAGVSKSLVSLVLRGSPRVSEEKREAVLAAVAELDYTPSRLAAGLAGTRTRSIGVIIDEFENLWFATALAGLRSALGEDGYSLSVADTALNSHLSLDPIDVFRSLRVDGIVLAGETSADAAQRLAVPAVVLGIRSALEPAVPVVASDETAGGRLAAAHLAELGHRSIACVSAPGPSAAAREAGYRAEMAERGLEPVVLRADQTSEAAARRALAGALGSAGRDVREGSLASAEPPFTAVFAVNDPMAVGVIGALRERGLQVPRDVSVVGYDDSPLAAYELVSLTSVSGDTAELGEAAGRTLLALLDGERDPSPAQLFAPRLVVRRSTAAPRR